MASKYNNCNVVIFDEDNNLLANAKVWEHDAKENSIELLNHPPELEAGMRCNLLILSEPSPYKCKGIVRKELGRMFIYITGEMPRHGRQDRRYDVNIPVCVEGLVCDGEMREIPQPVEASLVNISVSGIRLRAPSNCLHTGNIFKLRLKSNDLEKLMTAMVVNQHDTDKHSEFGCKLVNVKQD